MRKRKMKKQTKYKKSTEMGKVKQEDRLKIAFN